MIINTEHLIRRIAIVEKSYDLLKTAHEGSVEYEVYRNSLVKGFEIAFEQAGKLLKKRLAPFFLQQTKLLIA